MAVFIEKNLESEWFRKRLNILLFWIALAFFLLLLRLFYLQVVNGNYYRQLSLNNRIRLKRLSPARGLIYDRDHKLLVDNVPSFNIVIVPKDIVSIKSVVENLKSFFPLNNKKIIKKIKSGLIRAPFEPVVVAKDVDRRIVARIEANRFYLSGVHVYVEPKRYYLYPGVASHVLGYLGEIDTKDLKQRDYKQLKVGDSIGKSGIEKQYENILRGKYGGAQVEVNARGQVRKVLSKVSPEPGHNLNLTIDFELQKYAVKLFGRKAGAAVAMNPYTGAVLCMVSNPSYNENLFVSGMTSDKWRSLLKNPEKPLENKAIQGEYPPGSIFKIVVALAGLEEGAVKRKDQFICSGRYYFGDRYFRCWNSYGHGHVNLTRALIESCDIYFYKLGYKLGIDNIALYARKFGLGSKTGLDLPNEESGFIPDSMWKKKRFKSSWKGGETLSAAIGQGYDLVTPLQAAVMISVVANGGELIRPFLVKSVTDTHGRELKSMKRKDTIPLKFDKKNIDTIKKALYRVVNSPSGTAYKMRSGIISISGKTGTAQVVSSEKHKGNKRKKKDILPHAWFVAYAPVKHPAIAVAVLVEHGEHGASAAAPIVNKIIEKYYENRNKDVLR